MSSVSTSLGQASADTEATLAYSYLAVTTTESI